MMKNIIFTLFGLIICVSCSNSKLLNKRGDEVKYILSCEDFQEIHDENSYFVRVSQSKLKTDAGKEMGASIVALALFEEFFKKNKTADFNTKFGVRYVDKDSTEYIYSLSILASVKSGRLMCEDAFNNFIRDIKMNEILNKSNLVWNEVKEFGLLGFQSTTININENRVNVILFHYLMEPVEKKIWVYFDVESKKILTIVDPSKIR